MTMDKTLHIDSEVSIGFPEQPSTSKPFSNTVIDSKHYSRPDTVLDNVCCLLIYCQSHRRMLVKRNGERGLFLPYLSFRCNESWRNVAHFGIKRILSRLSRNVHCDRGQCSAAQVFNIFRIFWPQPKQCFTRVTVLVRLKHRTDYNAKFALENSKEQYCRMSTTKLAWIGHEDIIGNRLGKLLGPEVWTFYEALHESNRANFERMKVCEDCSLRTSLYTLSNFHKHLLRNVNLDALHIRSLYTGFVSHCFPSQHLSFHSFTRLIASLPLLDSLDPQATFRSFAYHNQCFLTFEELLFGAVAMDHDTPHLGPLLQMRLQYIFRFYDFDSDGKLDFSELSHMNHDILLKSKESGANESCSEQDALRSLNDYFGQAIGAGECGLTVAQFVVLATENRSFCQLSASIFRCPLARTLVDNDLHSNRPNSVLASLARQCQHYKSCHACRRTCFHIDTHAIRFGRLRQPNFVDLREQQSEMSLEQPRSTEKVNFVNEIAVDALNSLAYDMANRVILVGEHTFGLDVPQAPSPGESPVISDLFWRFPTQFEQLQAIKQLLVGVKDRLNEPKFIKLSSPCLVISGVFGNLKDLLLLSRVFWRHSPLLNQATYVFLGNVTGSQSWSVECVIYLLCMKILAPCRFIVLRGENEVRGNQLPPTTTNALYSQCEHSFDLEVWQLANQVFDRLPLGVTIEEQMFCTSHGFPTTHNQSLECLNATLEPVLDKPLTIASVQDILTNDRREQHSTTVDHLADKCALTRFCVTNRVHCVISGHNQSKVDDSVGNEFGGTTVVANPKNILLSSGLNLNQINPTTAVSSVALVTRQQIHLIQIQTFLPI